MVVNQEEAFVGCITIEVTQGNLGIVEKNLYHLRMLDPAGFRIFDCRV